jgi:hypothetical protein
LTLPAFAQTSKVVNTGTVAEEHRTYHSIAGQSALSVLGDGVSYSGVNLTLSASHDNFHGVMVTADGSLFLTAATVTAAGIYGYGLYLGGTSSGTLRNVNIEAVGSGNHGARVDTSSTLALIDSAVSATGSNAHALRAAGDNTVSLDHSTLTGGINVHAAATLAVTASNGSVLTGQVSGSGNSVIAITLTGSATVLRGDLASAGAIILTVGADALFHGGGTLASLTLADGARLGYTDGLTVTNTLALGAALGALMLVKPKFNRGDAETRR